MSTLRPPTTTSRSPSPTVPEGKNPTVRASMGPTSRPAPLAVPASPRPGGVTGAGRPTSELLSGTPNYQSNQTPEAEAIDQWFENLQNYEATLEEMAAASLDVNFKEELSAIEQWFRVLSEAERTAALYSLLQQSTHVQIRFFITVLQQMARSDPMTALLSPNVGSTMQQQMEARLASMSLKSPGLRSPLPASPSARNFNRQSLALDTATSNFLSPDAAQNMPSPGGDSTAAATLAQQRARLQANRNSAPLAADSRNSWTGAGASNPTSQLSQVTERTPSPDPSQEISVPVANNSGPRSARPKTTDFTGALRSARLAGNDMEALSPLPGDSWANMVSTPNTALFPRTIGKPAEAPKPAEWGNRVPMMDQPPKKKFGQQGNSNHNSKGGDNSQNNAVYDDNGNLIVPGTQPRMGGGGGLRNGGNWNQPARSPALSAASGRFAGSDDGSMNGMNVGAFGMGLGSPGLGMMPGMGMNPFGGMNMNMLNMANLAAMGLSPEAQLLAAQMAMNGQFGQPGMPFPMGMQQQQRRGSAQNNRTGPRSSNGRDGGSNAGSGSANKNKDGEEDFDPAVLTDVPAWLRSLRLHKYTPNFEGCNWRDMVAMDEAALEAKGVAALGARRKMLKTFEVVRAKMGVEGPAA